MKPSQPSIAFTLIELLVVISIIAILASLSLPVVGRAINRGQMTQTLSNARQITLATLQMSLESETHGSGNTWTRDTNNAVVGMSQFFQNLIEAQTLTTNDVRKLVNAPGMAQVNLEPGQSMEITPANCAFTIFDTFSGTADERAFLVTRNWQGGAMTTNTPYKTEGFIILRKGGDGSIYRRAVDASSAGNFGVTNVSQLEPLN